MTPALLCTGAMARRAGAAMDHCAAVFAQDRFGVSWQILPRHLPALPAAPKAREAFLRLGRIDIAALQRAAG